MFTDHDFTGLIENTSCLKQQLLHCFTENNISNLLLITSKTVGDLPPSQQQLDEFSLFLPALWIHNYFFWSRSGSDFTFFSALDPVPDCLLNMHFLKLTFFPFFFVSKSSYTILEIIFYQNGLIKKWENWPKEGMINL
jgi:hypothetical protein